LIKVFFDTNVLFAAIYSNLKGSYPSLAVKLALSGKVEGYLSHLVLFELEKNVSSKCPDKDQLLRKVLKDFNILQDIDNIFEGLPEADGILLSTAIFHGVDIFLTGNISHFQKFFNKKIGRTKVMAPKEFCLWPRVKN